VNPLSAIYGAGVGFRNRMYDRGSFRTYRLQAPVVSIGSISAGGAGKTPFLIMLGELLKERGVQFDVLSRGYGRRTKGVALVNPNGSAQEFGDEPLLIARKLGVPVIVGEDRYAAGKFAEEKFGSQLHLLDDGFQHRRLARDFDIALLTGRDRKDSLLPGGRLREPLSSLARATAIVMMDEVTPDRIPLRPGQRLWRVKRSIVPPDTAAPCLAFCGIARPKNFLSDLAEAGVKIVATREFRDHHQYNATDVESLFKQAQESDATAFVTTEKDAVNLGTNAIRLQPLHVVPVQMQFEATADGEQPVDLLCAALRLGKETHVRKAARTL
jgi:tetraacyldisaccharide 4'-kinase